MKQKITLFLVVLTTAMGIAQQPISVTYDSTTDKFTKNTPEASIQTYNLDTAIIVTVTGCPSAIVRGSYQPDSGVPIPKTPTVAAGSFVLSPFNAAEVSGNGKYTILITCPGGNGSSTYTITKGSSTTNTSNMPVTTAIEEIQKLFPNLTLTDSGFQVPSSEYVYSGDKYTHIFLDQFGNTLMGVIPQGISNRQYIVHIIYLTKKNDPTEINYSVKQTKGSFKSALVFNNSGQMGNITVHGGGGSAPVIPYIWAHQEFPLRISTDNIEFEVYRNVLVTEPALALQSTLVGKQIIEMTNIFHGSFDVGLLSTDLSDPNYELMPSENDPTQNVVKEGKKGNRGMVTVMGTLYTSPIVLIEKYILGMDIPNYKLSGRNFLDDHAIYERIFPAIGVSLNEKAFKNLFYGLNWEVARGASIFVGFHYGEVNTFDAPEDFKFGETVITEAGFNIRKDKQWKQDFAFGANLDLLIITNLFR